MKPKLLDLFCGAGGAGMGYHLAGFEVVGVDIKPQPRYPFEFHPADALEFAAQHGQGFDVIHASPPCQAYSRCQFLPGKKRETPRLINQVRRMLRCIDAKYVIENVPGAPLENPMKLEGRMFGLKVLRKRLFECNLFLLSPPVPKKPKRRLVADISEFDTGQYGYISVYGNRFSVPVARKAMGIDWMTRAELAQAIPPAYTEFIGRQIRKILQKQG